MNRRISTDQDSVSTDPTEQDEAPVTPRTRPARLASTQETFDDLPSAPLPLLYSLQSPVTPAVSKGEQTPRQISSTRRVEMTAPVNVSPTAMGGMSGMRVQYGEQAPQGYPSYPYAPQGKEMYAAGGPSAAYRRQSRFDPMANDDATEEEGYGDLGQRHPLRRVQEEDKDDNVSLPSIRNLFSVAGENHRASPVGNAPAATASAGPASPVSSSPTMQDARSRYSGSTFSSVSDAQFGWWGGNEADRGRAESTHGPFRANSYPNAGFEEDHDAKRRRSDQPTSMRDPEEAARLRWQAQNRNASYPAGSMSVGQGNGLRSLIHPPHGSFRGSVSINDDTAYPPPPPTHDGSMLSPQARNGSVGGQLARSFAELTAAEKSARASQSRSPSMAPPPAPGGVDRRSSSALAAGPLTRSSPLYEGDRRQSGASNMGNPVLRHAAAQPPSPDQRGPMRNGNVHHTYIDDSANIDPHLTGLSSADMEQSNPSEPAWSRRTSAAETHSSAGVNLNSDSEGSTAKGSKSRKRGLDSSNQSERSEGSRGDTSMGGMDVLAESAERAGAAAAEEEAEAAERDPSPVRNGTGPKYTCSFCQKTFSRPSSLRIHTYSHTGERPFVCQEPSCGRRFSVQSNLKRHAKVHALVNQQEAERLRALYAQNPHQQRQPEGMPPMHHHMPHSQQMPMAGMSPSGPAPPPHIMNMRDPRMYGGPMQHPGHSAPPPGSYAPPPHTANMPPHTQPVMPYGYPGMPSMHPPGMNPPSQAQPPHPPQMAVEPQHGYGNYGFYDQQGGQGMSGYGQPQQHPHTLPPPMSAPPHHSQGPQYHMQPGPDMVDPYLYQKN